MMQILVPVDFEPQSVIALEQSYNLARLLPAEIVLLYVYDPPAGVRSTPNSSSWVRTVSPKFPEIPLGC